MSVSFPIDRKGIIGHIQSGAEYLKRDKDSAAMKRKIEELVQENRSDSSNT